MDIILKKPLKNIDDLNEFSLEELTWLHDHNREVYLLIQKEQEHPRVEELLSKIQTDLSQVHPFSQFDRKTLIQILENVGAIQLENKCMIGCPFCGFTFNKLFGQNMEKHKQFPVEVLRSLFKLLTGPEDTPFMLYYESDPFNFSMPMFEDNHIIYSYPDVHRLYQTTRGFTEKDNSWPYVSTMMPKGVEKVVIDADFHGIVDRISWNLMNRKRLEEMDFREKIIERRWASRIIIKNNKWKREIGEKISEEDLRKEKEAKALVEKEGFALFPYHPLKMTDIGRFGRALHNEEYGKEYENGIGCFYGTLVTPYGIMNVAQGRTTNDCPDGQWVLPIPSVFKDLPLPSQGTIKEIITKGIVQFRRCSDVSTIGFPGFVLYNPKTGEFSHYRTYNDVDGLTNHAWKISKEEGELMLRSNIMDVERWWRK